MSAPAAGRVPPSDLEAEGQVLSACMLDPDHLLAAQELISPEHFYADANRRIFEACLSLSARGQPVDFVSVSGVLRDLGRLDQIGGTPYIAALANEIPAVANVAASCQAIREKFRLRRLISLCQTTEAQAYAGVTAVQPFIEKVEAEIYAISEDGLRKDTGATLQDVMAHCVTELNRKRSGEIPSGKLTPYKNLNRLLAGLKRGTVTVAAARPGMGKTSFLTELMVQSASDNSDAHGGVLFSLEMPQEQIGNKLMSQASLVDTRSVDTGFMNAKEYGEVLDSANMLRRLPIIVDEKASITVSEIRSALRRYERALAPVKLGLVGIDYLQLMGTTDLRNGMSTNDQLEHIMRGLCAIAKEFNVPVVLLSQLNREVEKRPDKRPNLGDLRSSGAIEQDAFNVIFLYRADQYRKPEEPKDNTGELIVAKARSGRPGTVKVEFIPRATKYVDVKEAADEFDDWGSRFDDPNDDTTRQSAEWYPDP